jgi:quercetin dioxygenase-like cupin family protein
MVRRKEKTMTKITNYREITSNELKLPGAQNTKIRVLVGPQDAPKFIMLMLELSPGGNTPYHDHEWEEEMFIISGKGTLKTSEGEKPVQEGDAFILAPNLPHQLINSDSHLLEVLCVIPKRN